LQTPTHEFEGAQKKRVVVHSAVLYVLTREGNSKAAVALLQEVADAVQKEEPRNAQLAFNIVSTGTRYGTMLTPCPAVGHACFVMAQNQQEVQYYCDVYSNCICLKL
jgi:hypothetical protein